MHPLDQGKPALTLYRKIAFREGLSLLALSPITGRKHQLRAHLSGLGCPIVGDKIYSLDGKAYRKQLDAELDAEDYRELGAERHLLHSFCLRVGLKGDPPREAWDWDVGAAFAGAFKALEARAWCATPAFSAFLEESDAARTAWESRQA
jgi:23S rRNA pseudouridine1911/1915/1917 synthase